ncbi:MAG: VOC family protein [Flavobacterium sp.]|uniref:VOC family protein n=1 Tax=Flavobacterium sp. TaxID=239 RepID=UPI00326665E6
METKMIWANLASTNLERIRKFYNSLGFRSNDNMSSSEIASFTFANNNFIINFFIPSRVKDDGNGGIGNWEGQSEVIFSLQADSKEKVDEWREKVHLAGGKIISEPQPYEQGYTFCFADPDGHKFNVLYWSGM